MNLAESKGGVLVPNIMIIALVSIGLLKSPSEEVTKPIQVDHDSASHSEEHFIQIRAASDPLESILSMDGNTAADRESSSIFQEIFKTWYKEIAPFENNSIAEWSKYTKKDDPNENKWIDKRLLLLVTMPGDNFPVSIEKRHRTRFAVVSALSNAGYNPTNPLHLGIVKKWNLKKKSGLDDSFIAFEEYEPHVSLRDWKSVNYSSVMVCYLNEEDLHKEISYESGTVVSNGKNPLRNMFEFINQLQEVRQGIDNGDLERRCDLQIIGPSTSSMYREFLASAALWSFQSTNIPDSNIPTLKWKSFHPVNNFKIDTRETPTIRSPFSTLSKYHIRKYVVNSVYTKLNAERVADHKTFEKNGINSNSKIRPLYSKSNIVNHLDKIKFSERKTHFAETVTERNKIQEDLGYTILRTQPDDESLCLALAYEIKNRGADIDVVSQDESNYTDRLPDNEILVIAEADTAYGRHSVESFIRACYQTFHNKFIDNKFLPLNPLGLEDKYKISWHDESKISCLRYFKGIQNLSHKKKPDESDDKNLLQGDESSGTFQTQGSSQADYINRLLIDIRQKKLLKKTSYRHIVIFSSNIYDKLSIIRELKSVMPNAQYYTTDLDATFFHPKEIKFTRNLVVASGYNLRLPPAEQLRSPPFRDTYQTATYLETLDSVAYLLSNTGSSKPLPKLEEGAPARREVLSNKVDLYEIGKNKHQLLKSFHVSRNSKGLISLSDRKIADWEKRPEETLGNTPQFIFWCAAALLMLFALRPVVQHTLAIRKAKKQNGSSLLAHQSTVFNVTCTALILLVWVCIFVIANSMAEWNSDPEQEPFSLFSGISAWPTCLIQLITINITIFCIWLSARDLSKNRDNLESIFSGILNQDNRDIPTLQKSTLWRTFFRYISFLVMPQRIARRNLNIKAIWTIYHQRSRQSERVCRSFVIFSILFGLSFWGSLEMFGKSFVPVRGADSRELFLKIQHIAFAASHFLTAYVIDACLLARALNYSILTLLDNSSSKNTSHAKDNCPTESVPIKRVQGNHKNRNFNIDLTEQKGKYKVHDIVTPHVNSALWETSLMTISARRCNTLYTIIMYPFIVYFFLIVSRSNHFDNFHWAPTTTIPTVLGVIVLFLATLVVRSSSLMIHKISDHRLNKEIELIRSTAHLYDGDMSNSEEANEKNRWMKMRLDALHSDEKKLIRAKKKLAPGFLNNPVLKGISYPIAASVIYYLTGNL